MALDSWIAWPNKAPYWADKSRLFSGQSPRLSGIGCNPHSTPESGVPMYGGYPCYLVGHTARIGVAAPFSRDQSGRLSRAPGAHVCRLPMDAQAGIRVVSFVPVCRRVGRWRVCLAEMAQAQCPHTSLW